MQVASDSFDHKRAGCIPELVEKVVTAVERPNDYICETIFTCYFYQQGETVT
jgi:hypothetical protein